jgi:molybdopterin synthase catalytic subunit
MRITVRYFALQRQQLGRRDETLELPDGASVDDAWAHLVALHSVLAAADGVVRFARNATYADRSEPLHDGDELALIPPVAGGAGSDGSRRVLELTGQPIDDARVAALRHIVASSADGAVVVFLGQTRETPGPPAPGQHEEAERHTGQSVEALEYEAFDSMALGVFTEIADEIEARLGLRGLAIVHRTGRVPLEEVSVVVAAAAPHRDAAFTAARYAIEELKARAPIWKAERFADGSVWLGAPARTRPAGEGGVE